ncbi:MAG: alpha/beta hydrolase [Candidatus Thorarchaeota archaeon]|nr:MAG: alpha/beta hydrolase [Candidatus Thorarchaeota archaeon]
MVKIENFRWKDRIEIKKREVIDLPYATIGDIDIYYEIHGPTDAPPLVLIGGWASYRWIWFRQIPIFREKYRCVVFDNRGAGKSSKPDYPYTIEMFADDTVGLMKALDIDNAHVLGISMGGLIAQQIAISYPEKVRSLIIASSHFGGPNQIRMDDKTMALLIALPTETISKEQAREMRYRATFSTKFLQENRSVIEQIDGWAEKHPAPLYAQVRQSSAVGEFNSESELKQISASTLIIHGDSDCAVPPRNGELLAENISNSKLILIEGGSHFSIIEKYEEFNNAVMNFIAEVDKG